MKKVLIIVAFALLNVSSILSQDKRDTVYVFVEQPKTMPYRNPGLSCFYSLLLPGVGQFYNGEIGKGFAFFFPYVISTALFSLDEGEGAVSAISLLCAATTIVWSTIDAARSSKRINKKNGFQAYLYPSLEPVRLASSTNNTLCAKFVIKF